MDKLEYMFLCQKDLQKQLMGHDLPADKPELVPMYSLGLVSEIGEVLQADKRWKRNFAHGAGDAKTANHERTVEELTDCFLYLTNLMLAHNVDYNDLFESFLKVQNKVRNRNNLPEVRYGHDNI